MSFDCDDIVRKKEETMKHKILKVLACISLIAMVFGAVTPGAFADETGTPNDTKFDGHKMMHTSDGNFCINNSSMAAPVFDSEQEEMNFLVERTNESVSRKIEMLQGMLDNIDEIDDENVTADSIQEHITELQALLADVESATTLDELKTIMEEYRANNPHLHEHGREHGPMGPGPKLGEEVTEE